MPKKKGSKSFLSKIFNKKIMSLLMLTIMLFTILISTFESIKAQDDESQVTEDAISEIDEGLDKGSLLDEGSEDDSEVGIEQKVTSTDEYTVPPKITSTSTEQTKTERIDFTDNITDVTLKKRVDNVWRPAKEFEDNDEIRVEIDYAFDPDELTAENAHVYYQLPAGVKVSKEQSGPVIDVGNKVGSYKITKDGRIEIDFDNDFMEVGAAIVASVNFEARLSKEEAGESGEITFPGDSNKVTIVKPEEPDLPEIDEADIKIEKSGKMNRDKTKISYELIVSSEKGSKNVIEIFDQINQWNSKNVKYKYDKDSLSVTKVTSTDKKENIAKNTYELSWKKKSETQNEGFSIQKLPPLGPNEQYKIQYDVNIDPAKGAENYLVESYAIAQGGKREDKSSNQVHWTLTIDPDEEDIADSLIEDLSVFSTDENNLGNEGQARSDLGVIPINRENTYENTDFYKNSKDSLFGIAGGFHLVGLDTVDRKAHVHGNILANNFINGGNFGTGDLKEVSYLRNISGGATINAGPHSESILVVGKGTKIGTEDKGNAWSINGNKVERPNKQNSPDSLWQDNDAEFIDFSKVEQQSKDLVNKLAELENNAIEVDGSDMNKQEILVTEDSNYNVYNLQDSDFNFNNPIHIKGFNKDKASTLIINVDMSKMGNKETLSIPNSVANYTDGSKVSTGEVNEWSNANVVWNVYDSSKSDNIYTGTVENAGAVTGSILAPGASINLKHNLNGTVIGRKIIVTGETHRDDYVPPAKIDYELPETGGPGTRIIYGLGLTLFVGGVIYLAIDRTQSKDKE